MVIDGLATEEIAGQLKSDTPSAEAAAAAGHR